MLLCWGVLWILSGTPDATLHDGGWWAVTLIAAAVWDLGFSAAKS